MICTNCEANKNMTATVTTADPTNMRPIWECPSCKTRRPVIEDQMEEWKTTFDNPRGDSQHKNPDSEVGTQVRVCVNHYLNINDKTAAQLYRHLGMQPYSWYRFFKSKGGPRIDRCLQIADFFGIELKDLFIPMPSTVATEEVEEG